MLIFFPTNHCIAYVAIVVMLISMWKKYQRYPMTIIGLIVGLPVFGSISHILTCVQTVYLCRERPHLETSFIYLCSYVFIGASDTYSEILSVVCEYVCVCVGHGPAWYSFFVLVTFTNFYVSPCAWEQQIATISNEGSNKTSLAGHAQQSDTTYGYYWKVTRLCARWHQEQLCALNVFTVSVQN